MRVIASATFGLERSDYAVQRSASLPAVDPAACVRAAGGRAGRGTHQRGANAAYLELFGNGGVFSINYERAVTPSVRLRVGAASWTAQSFWSDAETRFATFPLMLHVVPGRGAHRFEAAIGVLPATAAASDFGIKRVRLADGIAAIATSPPGAVRVPRGIDAFLRVWSVASPIRTTDLCRPWVSALVHGSEGSWRCSTDNLESAIGGSER